MKKITVIGLGPGDIGSLTINAIEKINNGNPIFIRTEEHPAVQYFNDKNIDYKSFDYIYEEKKSLEDVYEAIVKELLEYADKCGEINYCVPGNPILGENTVTTLIELRNKGEISLDIVSAMSFIEEVIIALEMDIIDGFKILDGINFNEANLDINSGNIITHVYNTELASEVKLKISERYGDDYEIYVIRGAGIKDKEKILKIPAYQLDRLEWIDHLTSIYVPRCDRINKKSYDMNNLIDIMEKLRSEKGCKWDIKQTHKSLRQYIIEEAYEVVDAIDKEDIDLLSEELGDLLLQVIFHSQIAREEGYFNIWDVITNICEKLIYRHPHVFGNNKADSSDEAIQSWNAMKDKEKAITSYTEGLERITRSLPALLRSYKVQEKAAGIGFDWDEIKDAIAKVEEELLEVREVLEGDDNSKQEEELGDLLFAIVNICRFMKINPETALNRTINKFIKRFSYIEKESNKAGKKLEEMSLEEMDELWEKSKLHNY